MKRRCVHFVGFRGDEFHRAVRVFGPPDFIHRNHDRRVWGGEMGPDDLVVFGPKANPDTMQPFVFDDSSTF